MRKAIIALAMTGALVSVAHADVTLSGGTGYRLQSTTVGTAPQTSADRYKLELNLNAKVNDSVTAVAGLRTGPVNSSYTDFYGSSSLLSNIQAIYNSSNNTIELQGTITYTTTPSLYYTLQSTQVVASNPN